MIYQNMYSSIQIDLENSIFSHSKEHPLNGFFVRHRQMQPRIESKERKKSIVILRLGIVMRTWLQI